MPHNMKKILVLLLCFGLIGCRDRTANYHPYSIGRDPNWINLDIYLDIDQYNVRLNAFTDALIQEIARIENIPFKMVNADRTQLLQLLEDKQLPAILSSLPPSQLNQDIFSFSTPLIQLGPVLVVPIHSKALSLEDLKGKIVSVNQYNNSVLIVQRYPSIIIREYQNIPTALQQLVQGEIDALLLNNLDAYALIPHLYPDQLKIVTKPLDDQAIRLITLKNTNKNMMTHFNSGLKKLRKTSHYSELRHYFQLK